MSTKNVHNWYFWTTTHVRLSSHEKADSKTSLTWKEVKGQPDKTNELILKTKFDLKEGPDNM